MSHSEYLKSLHEADGRKWLITEKNVDTGEAEYREIFPDERNPYTDDANPYRKALYEKKRKRRAYLHQVDEGGVSKVTRSKEPDTPYTWRLGYHACTAQYTGGDNVSTLSGSSLSRKQRSTEKILAKRRGVLKKSKPLEKPILLAKGKGIMYKSKPEPIHRMSKRTKAKIRDKATAFYRSIPNRIFVTLTFIEHVDDKVGKKILNKFLTVVRREVKGFQYLLISEHQPQRQQRTIHFHMLCNRRLTIRRFNNLWVLQQYNAGLTGHRANGEAISKAEIQARYKDGSIQKVLNPVKAEKAHCLSAISWYITKYVTKQKRTEKFGCLTWQCSRRVSSLFTSQVVSPSAFAFLRSFRNWKLDRQTGEIFQPRESGGPFHKVIYVNNKPVVLENLRMLETVNEWLMKEPEPDRRWGDWSRIYQQKGIKSLVQCMILAASLAADAWPQPEPKSDRRTWGDWKINWEQYRRVYVGKEMRFDPAGIVSAIVDRGNFLQTKPNGYAKQTQTPETRGENLLYQS